MEESSGDRSARPKRGWGRLLPAVGAVLSGVLLALCFPPFRQTWLIWFFAAPFLAGLWFGEPKQGKSRFWFGFRLGYFQGLTFFLINISWLTSVSAVAGTVWAGIAALGGLAGFLALYPAMFGGFAATLGRWRFSDVDTGADPFGVRVSLRVLRVAVLCGACWCSLEWLRSWVLTGFPWNGLGVVLTDSLLLLQFADVVGIHGYGFFMIFANVILTATIIRLAREMHQFHRLRPHIDFGVGAMVIIALFLYGLSKSQSTLTGDRIEVKTRILQLNHSLEQKWTDDTEVMREVLYDYRDYTDLFTTTDTPDLVVWPETALPGLFSFPWMQTFLNEEILAEKAFYLLTGLEDNEFGTEKVYNNAMLMRGSTADFQVYNKVKLVPVGEYLPFREIFPPIEAVLGGIIVEDFARGEETEPLVMDLNGEEVGIIPLICFEDTFGRHARKFVCSGPQLLVNVTNDGWFDGTAQPEQHFENARVRAIELRRPMVRAANTGVSGVIDEFGSVYDRLGGGGEARLIQDPETGSYAIRGSIPAIVRVPKEGAFTVYAHFGDWFPMVLTALVMASAMRYLIVRKLRRKSRDRVS